MDIEQIGLDLNIANSKASAALIGYNTFVAGKVGKIELTADQKTELKTNFVADITAVRDAAQAVIDEVTGG